MPKYAVHFTRIETRIVWANSSDDAIDVALDTEPPAGKILEDTIDIQAEPAEDDADALNDEHDGDPDLNPPRWEKD